MKLAGVADFLIEAPVVTSFTRVGYDVRSRLAHWMPLTDYDLTGRVVLVTGATSGLGLATSEVLAACGASVIILGRDPAKTEGVRRMLTDRTGSDTISAAVADMGELASVRAAAEQILSTHDQLDVVIHNAGTLSADRVTTSDGTEGTVASQVVGPFLLTALLLQRLHDSAPARVITMSSGGMYATDLTIDSLEMTDDYRGVEQYARAKRAQVTLNELWAERFSDSGVVFHAAHPGWADTPGVAASLPMFRRIVGPLLRTPEQGSDTVAWLAADDGRPLTTSGQFWLDREIRPIHKLPSTRRSDTVGRREQLWTWCVERSGIDPAISRSD